MQEKRIQERLVLKPYIKKQLLKGLWVILFLLVGMILTKGNENLKEQVKEKIFETSLPMMKLRNVYENYFQEVPTTKKEEAVFLEKLKVTKEEKTDTGVKLTVGEHELIPNLESGILVLIDNGKVIIEQVDGVSAIYNNIDIKDYKLYDYLEKGEILGESLEKEILISFEKEGKYYDYQKYL